VKTKDLNSAAKPWWEWRHATGEWQGARPWLDEHGVTPQITYTGEVFANLRGGINTNDATEYRGNVDITVTVDTEALGLWHGGTFFFYAQNGHGRGISERHVGDIQILSNIDANDFTQISEYWFEQRLFRDRVWIKLGKQDANRDFSVLDYGGDFINSSFGVIPTVPLPTFPDPARGAVALLDPAESVRLRLGVYDGGTVDGRGGILGVAELALRTFLPDDTWPPGTYRIGGWYHSDDFTEITDAPAPGSFSGNHGVYLAFDQLLLKEHADPEDGQGIGAFVQFGWAPDDRNVLARYVGGGMIYAGAVPGRDEDVLGIGVAHARFSHRLKRQNGLTNETVVEAFYKVRLTPWLALQPDFQFIVNPGGDGQDALAAGVRLMIDL
jgi:porin